jgi:N-acetylmuramic acid 6-phosphate etherase
VIHNPAIEKINLTVGPMAIAGSTRMQASTVLMMTVGIGLFWHDREMDALQEAVDSFIHHWSETSLLFLSDYIVQESQAYGNNEYILYNAYDDLGMTIVTDTTERSPTFSLIPFENTLDEESPVSLCYLCIGQAPDSVSAWRMLLGREPRTLNWPVLRGVAASDRLFGFDFSRHLPELRQMRTRNAVHHGFSIKRTSDGVRLLFKDLDHTVHTMKAHPLFEHLSIKMTLNTHSTLVMGRLGRYTGNLMTWVRPSNNKLIDRAIRYVAALTSEQGIRLPYKDIALQCFLAMETISADESLVAATVKKIIED